MGLSNPTVRADCEFCGECSDEFDPIDIERELGRLGWIFRNGGDETFCSAECVEKEAARIARESGR